LDDGPFWQSGAGLLWHGGVCADLPRHQWMVLSSASVADALLVRRNEDKLAPARDGTPLLAVFEGLFGKSMCKVKCKGKAGDSGVPPAGLL
jgi:hypothetical protein